jgi:Cys-rich protein (TIGR01571 family)
VAADCWACWCPCVQFGRNVEIIEEGNTSKYAWMDRSPLSTHPIPFFMWILHIYVPPRPVLDQWRGIQTWLMVRSSLKFICVCGWVGFVNYCLLGCLVGGGIFYCIHQHTCCGAMYSWGYRRKLRLKYGLPEQPCNDFCIECCCLPCSLAQQTRWLKSSGVDPNLGKIRFPSNYKHPLSFFLCF